jgi:AcrR family transcriptional regulator
MIAARTRKRGRPRDPAADQAILEAARYLLARKGFTGTSMEEIARRAGVGKDTLYRRWSSKEDLVLHLLKVIAEQTVKVPELDDPRYALFLFLQAIRKVNLDTDLGPMIAGVVGESARNERLAAGFADFWRERRSIPAALVRRIAPSTTTDGEIEVILDHILGPIYYRLLLTGAPVDDEYLWDLIATIPWSPQEHLITSEDQLNQETKDK